MPALFFKCPIIKYALLVKSSVFWMHIRILIWFILFKLVRISIAVVIFFYSISLFIVVFSRFFEMLKVVVVLVVEFIVFFNIFLVTKSPFHIFLCWIKMALIFKVLFIGLSVCLWLVFILIFTSKWLFKIFSLSLTFIWWLLWLLRFLCVWVIGVILLEIWFTFETSVKVFFVILFWPALIGKLTFSFIHIQLAVIFRSFDFVFKGWICSADLLEYLIFLRGNIWMILFSEYEVSFFYLLLWCIFIYPKDLVQISSGKLSCEVILIKCIFGDFF